MLGGVDVEDTFAMSMMLMVSYMHVCQNIHFVDLNTCHHHMWVMPLMHLLQQTIIISNIKNEIKYNVVCFLLLLTRGPEAH